MKRLLALAVVLLIGIAFLIGFLPQRRGRLTLEREVASLRAQLASAEERGRVCGLYVRLQGLIDVVAQKNYGQAEALSTSFFDDVRAESGSVSEPAFKEALQAVLGLRDAVTASVTKADPVSLHALRQAADLLRGALESRTPQPSGGPAAPVQTPRGGR